MKLKGSLVVALSALSATTCHAQKQKMSAGALERLGEQQLDAQTCERARAGTLGIHHGGLWFQDEAMLKQATSDEPNTGWEPSEVLLSHLGGGWGQLIPHDRPDRLIATRSSTWSGAQQPPTPAQLVTINTSSLAIQPWWDAPTRYNDIKLLGRADDVLVVLGLDPHQNPSRIWTFAQGRPAPLAELALTPDTQARPGPPERGHRRWPIFSRDEGIFLIDVSPTGQAKSTLFKTAASHVERASATEILLYFKDNSCALGSLDAPQTWSALPRSAQACLQHTELWEWPTLNDQLAAARYAATPASCQVQHRISLPPLEELPQDGLIQRSASILPLKPKRDTHVRHLIHGATLMVSFAMANESTVKTVSAPTFALALPPELLQLERVRLEGQTFWDVELELRLPYEPSPACVMGQLIFEAADQLDAPMQRAITREYIEFGKCE